MQRINKAALWRQMNRESNPESQLIAYTSRAQAPSMGLGVPLGKVAKASGIGGQSPAMDQYHINQPLTDYSLAYWQTQEAFVADNVFPVIPVMHRADAYYHWDRGSMWRDDVRETVEGTPSPFAGVGLTSETYRCKEFGLADVVTDQAMLNADVGLNPEITKTRVLLQKQMLHREIAWVADYFTATAWTAFQANGASARSTNFDPGDASNRDFVYWSSGGSTPIRDIRIMRSAITSRVGALYEPNVLVLGQKAYDILLDHPNIISRIDRGQTNGPAMAQKEALAALFELEDIYVLKGVQNTAAAGSAASYARIGDPESALLVYRDPNPTLETPTGGLTFAWRGISGMANAQGVIINSWYEPSRRATVIDSYCAYEHELVSVDLGCFINNAVQ